MGTTENNEPMNLKSQQATHVAESDQPLVDTQISASVGFWRMQYGGVIWKAVIRVTPE